MASQLPNIDKEVSNLLELACAKKHQGRSGLFNAIADLLERRHGELQPGELSLMSEILEKLISDVEMSIRKQLADRLALNQEAPAELVILLANDQIEVAKPVLLLSKILSDDELIKIIRHKTAQHHLSIASRKQLSSGVCRELVSLDHTDTIITLLNNHDAKINNAALAILVEKSKTNKPIQPPLIERPDLPKEMAARMYQWVSENLKQSILANLNLNKDDIDPLLQAAVKNVTEEDDFITKEKSEILLVNKLHKAGKLKPSFLMKCLNQGQSSLFEIAFAKLVNVPQKIMRTFLYDRGPEAVAVSCCAAGIDQIVFLTIYKLIQESQGREPNMSAPEVKVAFENFKKLDRKRAILTIKKWVADATGTALF